MTRNSNSIEYMVRCLFSICRRLICVCALCERIIIILFAWFLYYAKFAFSISIPLDCIIFAMFVWSFAVFFFFTPLDCDNVAIKQSQIWTYYHKIVEWASIAKVWHYEVFKEEEKNCFTQILKLHVCWYGSGWPHFDHGTWAT